MTRVTLTPLANEDLIEIWSYLAEAGEERATRQITAIRDKCQLLAEFPTMGRERDELIVGIRSFAVGRYAIFYQPAEDGIEVLRVLHASRDVEGAFDEQLGGE